MSEKVEVVKVQVKLSVVMETTIVIEKDVYQNISDDIFLLLAKSKIENGYIPWACEKVSVSETEI